MKVEFYHIDAFEAANYEPIWHALRALGVDARMVAVPGAANTADANWFDFDRLAAYYQARSVPFNTVADYDAVAVTTQNEAIIHPYRTPRIRLMYGPVLYPEAWGLQPHAVAPFDTVLVHGPGHVERYARWKDRAHLPIVGYPRYDDYFAGRIDRAATARDWQVDPVRPTLAYLPTWGPNSTFDAFFAQVLALRAQWNVVVRPHHCTWRFEPARREVLERSGIRILDNAYDLSAVYAAADVIMADSRSGALVEAVAAECPSVGLVLDAAEIDDWIRPAGLDALVPICAQPETLPRIVEELLSADRYAAGRRAWAERHVSFRDGTAGHQAALAIIDAVERATPRPRGAVRAGDNSRSEVSQMVSAAAWTERRVEETMMDASIRWIRQHAVSGQGIVVSSRQPAVYPEVTGYFIPTFLALGERELARQFAEWLVTVQRPDGAFAGPDGGATFAFDTGQVIRGWVAILPQLPSLEEPLRRACDWLIAASDAGSGRLPVPAPGGAWSLGPRGEVSEAIHLYCLAPLRDAGALLGESRYQRFAERSRDYYVRHLDCARFDRPNHLTHFYAYVQEALWELGCAAEVRRGMDDVARFQQSTGAVPAYHDVAWVCATGVAQLAQVWYRLGESARANAALTFLESVQNPSGGFWGSYGVGANYFPSEEPSWGVKYYVEAAQCRIADHFDRTTSEYRPEIAEQDGRAQAVVQRLGRLDGKRVLDAGAGKGRYAAMLKRQWPSATVTALDVSAEMLRHVPSGIETVQHSLLDLPFADGHFDAVICIEALEHAVQIDEAVRELVRVLAPGGVLVIIDKNKRHLGALDMPSWERWFDVDELTKRLERLGLAADAEFVAYDDRREPDGLFICWTGRKMLQPSAVLPESLASAAQ